MEKLYFFNDFASLPIVVLSPLFLKVRMSTDMIYNCQNYLSINYYNYKNYPTLKNQWAKYLEDASYILLSFYSFPDWLSEEAEADGVRQATSVDESNDELDSLHTVTVNPSKR